MNDIIANNIAELTVLAQLGVALVLGALIGIEREIAGKPAGLRTQMLVSGAAALVVALGMIMVNKFDANMADNLINSDPTRVIVAVVTGVSFIGAGTIIRGGEGEIEGLTTASSLLFTSVIGMSIGAEKYVIGVGATVSSIIILRIFGYIDTKIHKKKTQ